MASVGIALRLSAQPSSIIATKSPTKANLFKRPIHILVTSPILISNRHRKSRRLSVTCSSYHVLQDAGASCLVLGGAYALVSTFDNLTRRNIITQPCIMLRSDRITTCLTVFEPEIGPHIVRAAFSRFLANIQISTSAEARYFASLVPSINCARLVINGLSLASDEGLVKSVTREGKPEELLRGPLYYVLVLIFCAIAFWRDSPVGIISLAMMCGGDGIADIMGRRFGSIKIPYNQQKSWAGSLSMFLFGFTVSICMLYYFDWLGYIELEWMKTIKRIAVVSFVATAVESLPTTGIIDDNISVPLATMLTSLLVFG